MSISSKMFLEFELENSYRRKFGKMKTDDSDPEMESLTNNFFVTIAEISMYTTSHHTQTDTHPIYLPPVTKALQDLRIPSNHVHCTKSLTLTRCYTANGNAAREGERRAALRFHTQYPTWITASISRKLASASNQTNTRATTT